MKEPATFLPMASVKLQGEGFLLKSSFRRIGIIIGRLLETGLKKSKRGWKKGSRHEVVETRGE